MTKEEAFIIAKGHCSDLNDQDLEEGRLFGQEQLNGSSHLPKEIRWAHNAHWCFEHIYDGEALFGDYIRCWVLNSSRELTQDPERFVKPW